MISQNVFLLWICCCCLGRQIQVCVQLTTKFTLIVLYWQICARVHNYIYKRTFCFAFWNKINSLRFRLIYKRHQQMTVGKIRMSATLESDGNLTTKLFFDDSNSNYVWTDVLVDVCPLTDTMLKNATWKVKSNLLNPTYLIIFTRSRCYKRNK